jgi:multidrug efflux pump subunit AcrA (membrane-fusion protein)
MRLSITSGRLRSVLWAAVAAVLLAGPSGCAATSAPATTVAAPPSVALVEAPSLRPGTPVPAPTEPALLTLTGRIGSTNGAGALRLDADSLGRLGRIQVTVFDPWTKQNLQVQGPGWRTC